MEHTHSKSRTDFVCPRCTPSSLLRRVHGGSQFCGLSRATLSFDTPAMCLFHLTQSQQDTRRAQRLTIRLRLDKGVEISNLGKVGSVSNLPEIGSNAVILYCLHSLSLSLCYPSHAGQLSLGEDERKEDSQTKRKKEGTLFLVGHVPIASCAARVIGHDVQEQ